MLVWLDGSREAPLALAQTLLGFLIESLGVSCLPFPGPIHHCWGALPTQERTLPATRRKALTMQTVITSPKTENN